MKASIKKPVFIFLGFIFITTAAIILLRDIKLPFNLEKRNPPKEKTPQSVEITPKENKILITYSDLNLLIDECCSSVIRNVESNKDSDSIKVKGEASIPFTSNFEANIKPYVGEGKVKASVSNVTLGKVESPQMLKEKISELINLTMESKINSKHSVKNVKITNEGIEILLN